ncbi:MAG: ribosome small subunit-dependent GTPase A [Alkalispirochaeta sp.]
MNTERKDSYPALIPWGWGRYHQNGAEPERTGNALAPEFAEQPGTMTGERPGTARDGDVPTRPGLVPARVTGHQHHHYTLVCAPDAHRLRSRVSGAFSYRAAGPDDYPTVGDWVLLDTETGTIQEVLPRRTAISRKTAGSETLEQVIVANIDVALLVFAMDVGRGFTVGLVERAATTAWNSGARPVIVLNKVDLADAPTRDRILRDAETAAPGVEIYTVSARDGTGVSELLSNIAPDETVGMLGKSGVGKSALLNALARERGSEIGAREGELRSGDLQGRHTTTDKQLYLLPGGPIIADVPGLRELQLWADEASLDETFPEIEELSRECRFNDCTHTGEPGCRIQEALSSGELPIDRYERYLDLQREIAYLNRRRDQRAQQEEEMKWKKIAQHIRNYKKITRDLG